ncbi:hypothetical protein ZWY2020_037773 [Hordeum vulgare]|nr:hypothetical protein ZWY2020_037773 [Hordeum vulgare]
MSPVSLNLPPTSSSTPSYRRNNVAADMEAFLSGIMDDNALSDGLMDDEYYLFAGEARKCRIASDSSLVSSAFSAFLLGAISKSVATILTYPLIRCKVMIQAADPDDDDEDESERTGSNSRHTKTMLGAMHAMWNKEGIPASSKDYMLDTKDGSELRHYTTIK